MQSFKNLTMDMIIVHFYSADKFKNPSSNQNYFYMSSNKLITVIVNMHVKYTVHNNIQMSISYSNEEYLYFLNKCVCFCLIQNVFISQTKRV